MEGESTNVSHMVNMAINTVRILNLSNNVLYCFLPVFVGTVFSHTPLQIYKS